MKNQNSADFCLTLPFYFGYNAHIIQEQTKSQRTTCGTPNPHTPLHIVVEERAMKILEDRILRDGKVKPGNVLKVGGFLNHLIDQQLLDEIGKEISALFCGQNITKILTIEASGIAIACAAAHYVQAPVLFAKKSKTINISSDCYCAEVYSFTHQVSKMIMVEKDFLRQDDRVLIIDDFLANGAAINGLMSIVEQAGATLVGCAVAIEKGFQGGGDALREKGVNVQSLALIDSMDDKGNIVFRH